MDSNASSTDKRRANKQDYEQYLEDGYYKCPNENCDRKYVVVGLFAYDVELVVVVRNCILSGYHRFKRNLTGVDRRHSQTPSKVVSEL